MYLPTMYLPTMYLPTMYLPTMYLPTMYLPTQVLPTFLFLSHATRSPHCWQVLYFTLYVLCSLSFLVLSVHTSFSLSRFSITSNLYKYLFSYSSVTKIFSLFLSIFLSSVLTLCHFSIFYSIFLSFSINLSLSFYIFCSIFLSVFFHPSFARCPLIIANTNFLNCC